MHEGCLLLVTGIGLLSLPSALKQAGWAGLTIMVGMGIVMNYTGKILLPSPVAPLQTAWGCPAMIAQLSVAVRRPACRQCSRPLETQRAAIKHVQLQVQLCRFRACSSLLS